MSPPLDARAVRAVLRPLPAAAGKEARGRILVVEYKGAYLWNGEDAEEKRAVGNPWAARRKGLCLFVMPKGPDWAAITSAIAASTP